MLKKQKNSRKQGDVGLGDAIGYYTKQGYHVFLPLTDNQKYDLIVDNETLKRVQVKTTYYKTKYNIFQVQLKTSGGNTSRIVNTPFDPSQCDELYILTEDGDRYIIPTLEVDAVTSINLGKKWNKYKLVGVAESGNGA